MNWDRIEGNWKQFSGKAKAQWGKLTDNDIDVIAGRRDELIGKIQEQYGIAKDEAEKQVDRWGDTFRDEDFPQLPIGDDMKPTKLTMALMAAAGLCLAAAVPAQQMSKDARDMAVKNADSQYKMDKAACDSLSGNAKDVCVEQAKGKEKIAKAEADAAYENTPKARENARNAHADATFAVAKEKCDDLAGNSKDVCVKEANAAHVKAQADAKVDRVASDTRKDSADKTAAAQREASTDKRDADYKVAIEKCDSLAGAAKDACVKDAKARFGKS